MSTPASPPPSPAEPRPPPAPRARRGFLGWLTRLIPWRPAIEPLPSGMTVEIKAELIAQEHRLLCILRNAFIYGRLKPGDPRHQAAFTAGLWRLLTSPAVVTSAAVGTGLIASVATIILALQANDIAKKQTALLEQQKEQAMIQNALAEANRMALLHNEVTALTKEIAETEDPAETDVFERVQALSRVLEPYRTLQWQGNRPRLSERLASRERGELFLACARARLANVGAVQPDSSLYQRVDFDHADLARQTIQYLVIERCRLAAADLTESVFDSCRGLGVDLQGGKFTRAGISAIDLRHAFLDEADFRQAELVGVDFEGAVLPAPENFAGSTLNEVNFAGALVRESDWAERIPQVEVARGEIVRWKTRLVTTAPWIYVDVPPHVRRKVAIWIAAGPVYVIEPTDSASNPAAEQARERISISFQAGLEALQHAKAGRPENSRAMNYNVHGSRPSGFSEIVGFEQRNDKKGTTIEFLPRKTPAPAQKEPALPTPKATE